MRKSIVIISGMIAPKRQGNQSIRNTIEGFLAGGYRVRHFSFISDANPDYDFVSLQSHPNYSHTGAPHILMRLIRGRSAAGKTSGATRGTGYRFPAPDSRLDLGLSEITSRQILFARVYTVLEVVRVFWRGLFNRPDVLYGYEIYGAHAAYILGTLLRVPVVTRFQGTYVTAENWSHPPIQYHKRMLALPVSLVVMANDGTKGDQVLRRLGVDSARVLFLPNGLDARMFSKTAYEGSEVALYREEINPKRRHRILGIFNRYYPFKRIDRALRILRNVLDAGGDYQLVIASGGGPLEADLRHLADELELTDHVSWLGRVPFDRMGALYASCDLVLLLNDYANSGNQLYEAIIKAKPLLAIDDGNNSLMFGDCPYAHFFQPEEIGSIDADTIEALVRRGGTEYASSNIMTWSRRMEHEIEWIESKRTLR